MRKNASTLGTFRDNEFEPDTGDKSRHSVGARG